MVAPESPRDGQIPHQSLTMRGVVREEAEQDHSRHSTENNAVKPAEMLDQHHRTSS
jgi:hypothetical protein